VLVKRSTEELRVQVPNFTVIERETKVCNSIDVTVGGDSFTCMPSFACRGRLLLLAYFAC
jgi:N-acetylglutamate synthase-like GNAT family acetyltransferase